MHRIALLDEMEKRVTVKTNAKCTKIAANAVEIVGADGKAETLTADTVLFALGMKARRAETEALKNACPDVEIYEIGDCVAAGKVYDANRQGYEAALKL